MHSFDSMHILPYEFLGQMFEYNYLAILISSPVPYFSLVNNLQYSKQRTHWRQSVLNLSVASLVESCLSLDIQNVQIL